MSADSEGLVEGLRRVGDEFDAEWRPTGDNVFQDAADSMYGAIIRGAADVIEARDAEIERLKEGIAAACQEFYMLPAVNDAVPGAYTIEEVRAEAGAAIDGALARLHPLLDRPLTDRQRALAVPGADQQTREEQQ